MVTYTEGRHAAEFVMSEANRMRSRDNIVVASGQGVLAPGTVVGKITVGGEYAISANAEVLGDEGAETATAILLYEVDATSAAVEVAAITRDAEVNGNILTYDASVDNDAKKAAKAAQLAAVGIVVR